MKTFGYILLAASAFLAAAECRKLASCGTDLQALKRLCLQPIFAVAMAVAAQKTHANVTMGILGETAVFDSA